MYQLETITFEQSRLFGGLFLDYLNQHQTAQSFYKYAPSLQGFKEILSSNLYSELNRELLSNIAFKQGQQVENTHANSYTNIEQLKNPNTYTVTTGHQLCLFTGPLYFLHKIISVIQLAHQLENDFPETKIIPVYWMASEDHDADEINHAHVFGKKIKWNTSLSGAVGDFSTSGIELAIEELETTLGNLPHAQELIQLFKKSYLEHPTLSAATRYLVNELFGKYGLVVIDGNDTAFKKQFKEEFKKDIFENISYDSVSKTINELKKNNFTIQVNPREINCFYIDTNLRSRFEKKGSNYQVLQTTHTFKEEELAHLIESNPEKISPNVVLRPLYQQKILPNIAYCGGPGELAYWLEYLNLFKAYNIQFPVLIPRNFVTIADKITLQKITKLNLNLSDVFKEENQLIQEYLNAKGISISLDEEKNEVSKVFEKLIIKANDVDKTLDASAKGELQKALNGITAIESKINKALKNKSETEINQIKNIKSKLFPDQMPQERYENFSIYYAKYGSEWLNSVFLQTKVLSGSYQILTEI